MKSININETGKFNGELLACFLFQYSLLIPLMIFLPSSLVVGISGIILIALLFLKNIRQEANAKILLFFIISLLIICIKTLVVQQTSIYFLIQYVMYTVPAGIMLMYKFDLNEFLNTAFKLSYINLIINCTGPFLPAFNYMRLGYGLLPSAIFLYVRIAHFRQSISRRLLIITAIFMMVTAFEICLYGARGSFLAFMLFVALDVLLIEKRHIYRNVVFIGIGLAIYKNLLKILTLLLAISSKIGIYSYAITKFIIQIDSGMAVASSGRNVLYKEAIKKIIMHPVIGNPINPELENGDYVHNLFLQVGLDLGIGGIIMVCLLLMTSIVVMFSERYSSVERVVMAVLFAIGVGRLLISSTLWERPEFWIYVCYTLTMRKGSKKRAKLVNNNLFHKENNKI